MLFLSLNWMLFACRLFDGKLASEPTLRDKTAVVRGLRMTACNVKIVQEMMARSRKCDREYTGSDNWHDDVIVRI